MTTTIKLYIPRISIHPTHAHIPIPQLLEENFNKLQIGKIIYLDIHERTNEAGHPYYFAFIDIESFENIYSLYVLGTINKYGSYRVVYDEANYLYWEVKQYIEKSQRGSPVTIKSDEWLAYSLWKTPSLLRKHYEFIENLPNFI
jgi:hypothetical protein